MLACFLVDSGAE